MLFNSNNTSAVSLLDISSMSKGTYFSKRRLKRKGPPAQI